MGWSSGMTRVHVKVQDLYDHKLNMSQHYYSVAKKKKKKKILLWDYANLHTASSKKIKHTGLEDSP